MSKEREARGFGGGRRHGGGPGGPGGHMLREKVKLKDSKGTIRRLWRYLKDKRFLLALVALFSLISSAVSIVGIRINGSVVDDYVAVGDLTGLIRICLILIADGCHIYIAFSVPVRIRFEAFGDLSCTFARANKVVACMHFIHRYGLSAAPVCHDHSLESPFVSCKCGTQIIIIGCRSAVVLVVRGHDRHRLCLFYNCFKTFEVDFTDCSFRNCIVLCISVCFLRVHCIMLNSNANAFV